MDFVWHAQMHEHTDISLAAMKSDLVAFHASKNIFIENGAHASEAGNLLEHFNILKLHMLLKYEANIQDLGAPNNFGTEVTETLHHSTCHKTFAATNKNTYESQMLHNLNCREGLMIAAQFFGWRQNQYLDNLDDNAEDGVDPDDLQLEGLEDDLDTSTGDVHIPALSEPGVYIAQCPYATAGIQDIVETFCLNELPGSIQQYIDSQDIRVTSQSQYLYQAHHDLPAWAQCLGLWKGGTLISPHINQFYEPEWIHIQAQYQLKDDQPLAVFDTILVKVNPASPSPQSSMCWTQIFK